jgi:diguanylate cyclase (GGDEF)-like protein
MRISTITNWAYGLTIVLTGLAAAAFLLSAEAARNERQAVEQHLAFDVLAEDLSLGVETLTDEARLFAVRGAPRHLEAYRHEIEVVRTLDGALRRVRAMKATPAELAAITEAERHIDDLQALERSAVSLAESGDRAAAEAILFGPEHERAQSAVITRLESFRALASARTETAMHLAHRESDRATLVAKIMLGLTAALFLCVLYFVLKRRVSVPLSKMTGIVMRLAKQDFEVEVPDARRKDEIGDMTTAIQVFRENGLARDRLEAERAADQRIKDSLLQMMHRLQACENRGELAEVVTTFAPLTFPDLAGQLFIYEDDRNALSLAGSWLEPTGSLQSFAPTACWALRRGRPHMTHGEQLDVPCLHVVDPEARTLCVPLTAQGDTIGLLYFEGRHDIAEPQPAARLYLELMSDNIALALANLRLRERLANLAVRDGLTGLFNRRSLDETLARSAGEPLACIMVDIDHFKRFNDEHGHDAGDAVMQHVARLMSEVVGDDGAAYRFGGEEFTILLPGASRAAAMEKAEILRTRVGAAPLAHHGRMLGHITISLGLAAAPDDGPAANLLRCADAALLEAKAGGRNRTVAAGPQQQNTLTRRA